MLIPICRPKRWSIVLRSLLLPCLVLSGLNGQSTPIEPTTVFDRAALDSLETVPDSLRDSLFYRELAVALPNPQAPGYPERIEPFFALAEHLLWDKLQPLEAEALLRPLVDYEAEMSPAQVGYLLDLLASSKYLQHQPREAREILLRSVKAFEKLGTESPSGLANAYRRLGDVSGRLGDINSGVAFQEKAADLFLGWGDTLEYLQTTLDLSLLLGQHGFYELARTYRSPIFTMPPRPNVKELVVIARFTAIIELFLTLELEEAAAHLQEAARLLETMPFHPRLHYFYHRISLGLNYLGGDSAEVERHFSAIETLQPELGHSPRYRNMFIRDKAMYLRLAGQPEAALALLLPDFDSIKVQVEAKELVVYYELMKDLHEDLGQFQAAYDFSELKAKLQDSLATAAKLSQTTYYQTLYQKERDAAQKREIETLVAQNQNRIQWLILLGVIVLLVAISVFLYRYFRSAKRESHLRRRFAQDLLRMRERERKRMAMDLHDRLGSNVALLSTQTKQHPDLPSTLQDTVDTLLEEVRSVSREWYDVTPDEIGLLPAIEALVDRFDRNSPVFFHLELPREELQLGAAEREQLFAIVQEGLQNIIKHAEASSVHLKIEEAGRDWIVSLRDNGKGGIPVNPTGIGLRIIEERVAILGGNLQIESETDVGTTIRISLPKNKNE